MARLSPTRSPSKYTTAEAFSPQIYANYPVLDSVLIYYLDIESLIQRHQVNPAAFETRESLNLLAQRFALTPSTTFPTFLAEYDAKYATVRSYFLLGADPEAIMLKAAEAGELQAFYLGLRRNPRYKTPYFLDLALKSASRGGHQVMIDLIKDLGGTSFKQEVRGTAEGGHLEKLKRLISQGPNLSPGFLSDLTSAAVRFGQLATFKYLITLWHKGVPWDNLIYSAGISGDQAIIDYIISQGGKDYTELILGAIYGDHLDLAVRYLDKPGLDYSDIFRSAVKYDHLELAKLVARDHKVDQDVLNDLMARVSDTTTYEAIDYLISLGANNYHRLVSELARHDYIELFKRYYRSPDINFAQVLTIGLQDSSVEVVKFMLEKPLVSVTEKRLNSYLKLVRLNSEVIELLFSLGATDYEGIVKRALFMVDIPVAAKYFDRAPGLELNSIFKQSTSVRVYRYLLSQGPITQATLDTTLARLPKYKNKFARANKYLRRLGAKDGGSID
jgi:hypothetical protein